MMACVRDSVKEPRIEKGMGICDACQLAGGQEKAREVQMRDWMDG